VSLGVDWHLPARRGGFAARRFATTTRATSDLIEVLAGDGHTVQSAHDAILYDDDAKAVLARFIDAGHADVRLDTLVRGR
jgi:hypothetical protein